MKNKVEISKINIRIGDKEIPLTLAEAQELRQILDETFGQKTVYLPSMPIIIERPYPRVYPYWHVDYTLTSDGTVGTMTLSSGNVWSDDSSQPLPVS